MPNAECRTTRYSHAPNGRTMRRGSGLLFGISRLSLLFATVLLFIPDSSVAQNNELSLTVYTNGLGLIREVRSIELDKGRNTVLLPRVATQIDPTSVRVRALEASDRISILEQRYTYDLLSGDTLLQKYINREVDLSIDGSDIMLHGRLLSPGAHVALLREDGRIDLIRRDVIRRISVSDLPEDLVTEPTLTWLVNNTGDAGNHPMEVSYLTQGMNWHVEYTAVVNANETNLSLSSWASIENQSGITYENADLTLVAGEVNRVPQKRRFSAEAGMARTLMSSDAPQFDSQQMFEYHSYTLARKGTIENNATVQLAMLDDTEAKVSKHYVYDGAMQPNGVQTRFRLENRERNGLGFPMPRGKVRMYLEGKDSRRQFIGEDTIRDLAKGETAYLTVGHAFDINGERSQTSGRQPSKGVMEESYKIVLRNNSSESVSVKVIEHLGMGPNWNIRASSHPYEKLDARTIEFDIPVRNGDEIEVTYTVEYRRER